VRYILAVHVPITGLALLPLLLGGPLVLLPLHVVFLELIIDPACSFVFEREPDAADIMRRPPRPSGRRMVDARTLVGSLLHGAVMFAALLAIHALAGRESLPDAQAGALAFTSLVSGNLGLILLYRQGDSLWQTLRQRNPAFWIVALIAMGLLGAMTWIEAPSRWFGFAAPPLSTWLLALALPLSCALAMKFLQSRTRSRAAMR
jgi:Ca2+-transporting ATPase